MINQQTKRFSNVIGFDDAPFDRHHRGGVNIVGTVYAGLRLDGIIIGEIEKDGFDAADEIIRRIETSRFLEHIQLIILQGIAFGGFNVIDVFSLHKRLAVPLLVVARKTPDVAAMEKALTGGHIPHGQAKWEIITRLGPMEPVKNIYVQRVGLTREQAADVIERFCIYGNVPEPLRSAHLIAGALSRGYSRGRP